jgi:hypothetical protein
MGVTGQDVFGGLWTVDTRHVHVHQDQVGLERSDLPECLLCRGCLSNESKTFSCSEQTLRRCTRYDAIVYD